MYRSSHSLPVADGGGFWRRPSLARLQVPGSVIGSEVGLTGEVDATQRRQKCGHLCQIHRHSRSGQLGPGAKMFPERKI